MILQPIDDAPQDGSPVTGYGKDRSLGEIRYVSGRWINAAGATVEPRHFTPRPIKALP